MKDGRLPVLLSTSVYAGYGEGRECDLCDQPIADGKIEYVVPVARDGRRLHFHFACHTAWQRECALLLKEFP
jgi:hypothetical protein